jgi:hypothetical protein
VLAPPHPFFGYNGVVIVVVVVTTCNKLRHEFGIGSSGISLIKS